MADAEPPGDDADSDASGRARSRAWLRSAGRRPTVGRGITGRLRAVGARVKGIVRSIHALLVGDPERYPVRALLFLAILSGLTLFIGLYLFAVENLDPSANSGPLVRTVVSVLTNFFAWAALSVIVAVVVINRWWHRAATRTAAETRFSVPVVKRLRHELTTTDGTHRLIGTPDHARRQLRAKLMRAFAEQHPHEQPGRDVDVSPPEAEHTGKALGEAPEAALPETGAAGPANDAHDAHDEPGAAHDDTGTDADHVDVDDLHDAPDLATALARGSDDAVHLGLVTALGGYAPTPSSAKELTLVQDAVDRHPDITFSAGDEFLLSPDGDVSLPTVTAPDPDDPEVPRSEESDPDATGDASGAPPSDAPAPDDTDTDDPQSTDTSRGEQHAASFRQAIQTFRMDIATSLNFQEVLTRFGIPAGVTVLLTFTVAGTPWFAPWVYPVILAGASLVGLISYGTFKWRRRRKVRQLRQDPGTRNWGSCAVLAKRVDTPEQTMYAAWMGGNRYADFDKQRLIDTVADRWYQRLHGDDVAPAIQQKFAREIRHARPLLHQFEHRNPREGRKGIEDDIIDVIREAKDPDGMVAKRALGEQVVERGPGIGHDPDLVAEVYADLVPQVLTETEITLRDTDGVEQDLTAVHLRWMDVPDDLAQIRAQFANQFSADETATYSLPEVSAAGAGKPAYAAQLADLPTEGPRSPASPSSTAD